MPNSSGKNPFGHLDQNALAEQCAIQASALGQEERLIITQSQLQHVFKHAKDFGVEGNWNKAKGEILKARILDHIEQDSTEYIEGSYNHIPVIYYYNPMTNLNVIASREGRLISGWRLNAKQIFHLTTHHRLGGR